jgi:hypothetical protein
MRQSLASIETTAHGAMTRAGFAAIADRASKDCAWLEAVAYPGLKMLAEALQDQTQAATLEPDALGLDLQQVSCIFLADDIQRLTRERGRLFLRNVRHGLYLVPDSVRSNYAIGCPIDPGFPLGGERSKNPYVEKLEAAARDGVEVDDTLWQSLL